MISRFFVIALALFVTRAAQAQPPDYAANPEMNVVMALADLSTTANELKGTPLSVSQRELKQHRIAPSTCYDLGQYYMTFVTGVSMYRAHLGYGSAYPPNQVKVMNAESYIQEIVGYLEKLKSYCGKKGNLAPLDKEFNVTADNLQLSWGQLVVVLSRP
jgi:hypothetical protein